MHSEISAQPNIIDSVDDRGEHMNAFKSTTNSHSTSPKHRPKAVVCKTFKASYLRLISALRTYKNRTETHPFRSNFPISCSVRKVSITRPGPPARATTEQRLTNQENSNYSSGTSYTRSSYVLFPGPARPNRVDR